MKYTLKNLLSVFKHQRLLAVLMMLNVIICK